MRGFCASSIHRMTFRRSARSLLFFFFSGVGRDEPDVESVPPAVPADIRAGPLCDGICVVRRLGLQKRMANAGDEFDHSHPVDINMAWEAGSSLCRKQGCPAGRSDHYSITAYGEANNARRGAGAEALLTKPIDFCAAPQ